MKSVERLSFFFIFFLVISVYSVIFINSSYLGINDFDFNFTNMVVSIDSLTKYFEFPLWNPYDHGGTPLLAQPYSSSLSPFNILSFILSPIHLIKVKIVAYILMGSYFAYYAFSKLLENHAASLYATIIYIFSSYFALNITQGQYEFLSGIFIPLLLISYNKDDHKSRSIFALSFFMMFLEGGVYNIVISCFLLFLIALPKIKSLKIFICNVLFGVGLSSVKLFPTLELMASQNRKIFDISGYSVWSLIHGLINRDQFVSNETNMEIFYERVSHYIGLDNSFSFLYGISSRWDEYGIYIGVAGLIIFAIGLILTLVKKENLSLVVIFIISLILSFGYRLPYSPWHILSHFPVLDNMRHPARFRVFMLLSFAVLGGVLIKYIYELLLKRVDRQKLNNTFILILSLFSIDYILVNQRILSDAFVFPSFKITSQEEFSYIRNWQKDPYYLVTTEEGYYPAYLENKGLIFKKETQNITIATKAKNDKEYIAEAYSSMTKKEVKFIKRTNNSVTFNTNSLGKESIIFNQNFYPGWKSSDCIVQSNDGLIELKNCVGDEVKLFYRPLSFIFGFIVSILFFVYLFKDFSILVMKNKMRKFSI